MISLSPALWFVLSRIFWGVIALALAFIAFWLLLDSDCEHAPEAVEDYDRHLNDRGAA
jgi:hypothetical protein